MNYIDEKVHGLPKPLRKGHNTSPTSKRKDKEYIHKVTIGNITYYKFHMERQGKSKIKYFKKLKNAKLFAEMVRANKYL